MKMVNGIFFIRIKLWKFTLLAAKTIAIFVDYVDLEVKLWLQFNGHCPNNVFLLKEPNFRTFEHICFLVHMSYVVLRCSELGSSFWKT